MTWIAAGQRKFNVAINGTQVLTGFDVYAIAGHKTALRKQFSVAANGGGQIAIAFTQGGAQTPAVRPAQGWDRSTRFLSSGAREVVLSSPQA